jgi:hypothetical protein
LGETLDLMPETADPKNLFGVLRVKNGREEAREITMAALH